MAKAIPETKTDWAKWIFTLIAGSILSAYIGYYVTQYLKSNEKL
jgi:uncharacterized membrane protein YfcA